jgi:hypothetical protein
MKMEGRLSPLYSFLRYWTCAYFSTSTMLWVSANRKIEGKVLASTTVHFYGCALERHVHTTTALRVRFEIKSSVVGCSHTHIAIGIRYQIALDNDLHR